MWEGGTLYIGLKATIGLYTLKFPVLLFFKPMKMFYALLELIIWLIQSILSNYVEFSQEITILRATDLEKSMNISSKTENTQKAQNLNLIWAPSCGTRSNLVVRPEISLCKKESF